MINISKYTGIEFSNCQSNNKGGINMTIYNEMEFNSDQVEQIKDADDSNTCEMKYPKRRGISKEKMDHFNALMDKPTVSEYDTSQDSEIMLGILNGIDVSIYAKPEYSGAQMHELRLGLEARIDVSAYANPKLSSNQMKELREDLLKQREGSSSKEDSLNKVAKMDLF